MNPDKEQFKILVVIPAYNEEDSLGLLLSKIKENNIPNAWVDCLVIDDGSQDGTARVAQTQEALLIKNGKNQGVGFSLSRGVEYALSRKYDLAVNIDADNQFEPRDIGKLITPILNQEADMVVGERFSSGRPQNMPVIKYFGNKIMNRVINTIIKGDYSDVSCGFRAYNQNALINLNLFGKFTYTQEMFLDLYFKNINIKQVPVQINYFPGRRSRVAGNLFSYFWKTSKIILRSFVYFKPLKFFGIPALMSSITGLGFVGFLLFYRLNNGSYTPFKAYGFIGAALLFFGLLLMAIGLMSDILDKNRRTNEKILYLLQKDKFLKKNKN